MIGIGGKGEEGPMLMGRLEGRSNQRMAKDGWGMESCRLVWGGEGSAGNIR